MRAPDQLWVKLLFFQLQSRRSLLGASVPGFPALRSFENRNLAITETHIFSPRAINQFRFGFSRLAGKGVAGGTLTDQEAGIDRFSDPQEIGIPRIEVLGAFQLGNSANDRGKTANNNVYTSDVLFLSRGRHDIRLGTEIFRNQFDGLTDNTAGIMILVSFPDFLLGLPAGPVAAGGSGTSFSNLYASGITAGILPCGGTLNRWGVARLDNWKALPH